MTAPPNTLGFPYFLLYFQINAEPCDPIALKMTAFPFMGAILDLKSHTDPFFYTGVLKQRNVQSVRPLPGSQFINQSQSEI